MLPQRNTDLLNQSDFEPRGLFEPWEEKSMSKEIMSPKPVMSSSGNRRAKPCTESQPGELHKRPGGFVSG